jgi:hypothetical protein
VQLVERGGAGLDRAAAGHAQRPDALHRAGAGLPCAARGAGQHRPGRGDRIDRIGLALSPPGLAVGPAGLDHGQALSGQVAGQAGAAGAGALHPDLDQPAEAGQPGQPGQPGQQRPVAGRGRGELGVTEQPPAAVDRGRVLGSAVRVHTTENIHVRAVRDCPGAMSPWQRASRSDKT